jgi:proteasome lid subunit RPN8/RPN11
MEMAASASSTLLDPHALISPQIYSDRIDIPSTINIPTTAGISADQQLQMQPFKVIVHPQVQLLCDLHSHLCDAEIIGFLAGKYDHHTKTLFIQACFPCNSLERTEDDGSTDVEMDPIAELSVREVISKYNLDVVGWYHSHPLFRPDPSTTDILNQFQYQQLFDSEPFVGLIVSTCDPELPSFESRHQWFHSVPMISSEDLTQTKSNRVSKRKLQESDGHLCTGTGAGSGPMYVPMKIEIVIAELRASHVKNGIVTSFVQSQVSESLQNSLLQITKEQLETAAEAPLVNRQSPSPDDGDDCVFIETRQFALPSCLCQSSIATAKIETLSGQDLSHEQQDDDSIKMNGNGHHHPPPHVPSPQGDCDPQENCVETQDDSVPTETLPVRVRSSKRSKGHPKLLATESLLTIRQPERITRSYFKKLNETSMVAKKVPPKKNPKGKKPMKKIPPPSPPPPPPEEEQEETQERAVTPTSNSSIKEIPSRAKRVRKESFKKATDATPQLSSRPKSTRRSAKLSKLEPPLPALHVTSEVALIPPSSQSTPPSSSPSLSPEPPPSDLITTPSDPPPPSDLSSSLPFHQLFQFQSMDSSSFARSFLCSSPPLLRYVSLCTVALGYYYCSYRRRTNLGKKYRSEYKSDKIKYSLLVWIRYLGLNEEVQEEYLNKLITFMKYCWLGT